MVCFSDVIRHGDGSLECTGFLEKLQSQQGYLRGGPAQGARATAASNESRDSLCRSRAVSKVWSSLSGSLPMALHKVRPRIPLGGLSRGNISTVIPHHLASETHWLGLTRTNITNEDTQRRRRWAVWGVLP